MRLSHKRLDRCMSKYKITRWKKWILHSMWSLMHIFSKNQLTTKCYKVYHVIGLLCELKRIQCKTMCNISTKLHVQQFICRTYLIPGISFLNSLYLRLKWPHCKCRLDLYGTNKTPVHYWKEVYQKTFMHLF
jgi:hypothetical protein